MVMVMVMVRVRVRLTECVILSQDHAEIGGALMWVRVRVRVKVRVRVRFRDPCTWSPHWLSERSSVTRAVDRATNDDMAAILIEESPINN